MSAAQVRTRARVIEHGEVYTAPREVEGMLGLVADEAARIESRFLEPACGNGNFMAAILERKLKTVEARYARVQLDFERHAVLAVSSIYGIDLLEDNVQECRARLLGLFNDAFYQRIFGTRTKQACRDAVRFILEQNVIWGDALTLRTVGPTPSHIVFPEWSPINGTLIKRRDFTFHALMAHESSKELPLFSDLGKDVFIPTPVREYPPVHFLELG
jgi:hypothetical protein